jgi:hypothetical protein
MWVKNILADADIGFHIQENVEEKKEDSSKNKKNRIHPGNAASKSLKNAASSSGAGQVVVEVSVRQIMVRLILMPI